MEKQYRIDQLRYLKYRKSMAYYQITNCGTCGKVFPLYDRLYTYTSNAFFNVVFYTVRSVELDKQGRPGYDAFPLQTICCSTRCANMWILSR